MAIVQPVDVSTLTKWEDAFQQPVANVRVMERQLRGSLDVNREKLRTLVGFVYQIYFSQDIVDLEQNETIREEHEWLTDSLRIIQMDQAIQKVEGHLAETSRGCNHRLLERKASNLKAFKEKTSAQDRRKFIFAAQLAILQNCPMTISRLIHTGGSSLLAAKVYVIATLLLKSISQKVDVPITHSLRKQLSSLRSILSRHIDQQLRSGSTSMHELIEAMKAFSLVNSASCTDVLVHFQIARLDAISSVLDADISNMHAVVEGFKIFHSTLQDTLEIFPRRFSEALANQKGQALFTDLSVKELSALNFEAHEQWVPEDIRNYTRWVRHDDLDISRVQLETKLRTANSVELLHNSLEKALHNNQDLNSLVSLRKQVSGLWRLNKPKLNALNIGDGDVAGERFRNTLNERIKEVLQQEVIELGTIAGHVVTRVQDMAEKPTDDYSSILSDKVITQSLSNGGKRLIHVVKSLTYGDDVNVKCIRAEYERWLEKVARGYVTIKNITKDEEWNPDEDEDDDLDTEPTRRDHDELDATMLEEQQTQFLTEGYNSLFSTISKLIDEIGTKSHEADTQHTIEYRATFLLRVLRTFSGKPPFPNKQSLISLEWFGKDLATKLYIILAKMATKNPVKVYGRTLRRRQWHRGVVFKKLWEGVPSLPNQPSPSTFKLLHELVLSMRELGVDIWKSDAVKSLKDIVSSELWASLEPILGEIESSVVLAGVDNNTTTKESIIIASIDKLIPVAEIDKEGFEITGNAVNNSSVEEVDNDTSTSRDISQNVVSEAKEATQVFENNEEYLKQTQEEPSSSRYNHKPTTKDKGLTNDTKVEDIPNISLPPKNHISQDRAMQTLFDLCYLDNAFKSTVQTSENHEESSHVVLAWEYCNKLQAIVSIDDEVRQTICTNASEYWKRTSLLFGLLDI